MNEGTIATSTKTSTRRRRDGERRSSRLRVVPRRRSRRPPEGTRNAFIFAGVCALQEVAEAYLVGPYTSTVPLFPLVKKSWEK